jgi:hypothetical protein
MQAWMLAQRIRTFTFLSHDKKDILRGRYCQQASFPASFQQEYSMKPLIRKALLSFSGILLATVLFFSPGLRLPVLDDATDAYFRAAITKAGLSYATCRIINASVSVVKESSLHLQPAGVGVSLAAGQALDPIDDLTERVSDILVTAITSLGVQKLAYEIGVSLVPPLLAVFIFILSVLVWLENRKIRLLQSALVRLALLFLIARFCLPLSALANEFINDNFFHERIVDVRGKLSANSNQFDKLKDFSLPETGILGTGAFLKKKTIQLADALVEISENMGEIVDNLLQLAFLYVGIFLIQVIVLPLLAFYILFKLANTLLATTIPQLVVQYPLAHTEKHTHQQV